MEVKEEKVYKFRFERQYRGTKLGFLHVTWVSSCGTFTALCLHNTASSGPFGDRIGTLFLEPPR